MRKAPSTCKLGALFFGLQFRGSELRWAAAALNAFASYRFPIELRQLTCNQKHLR
jgi:hypothetical protein